MEKLGLNFEKKRINNIVVIYPPFKVDATLSDELNSMLDQIIENDSNSDILLNLRNVDFISSSGLRVIVATWKKLSNIGRDIKVCTLNDAIRDIFNITQLNNFIDLFDTEENAIAAFDLKPEDES